MTTGGAPSTSSRRPVDRKRKNIVPIIRITSAIYFKRLLRNDIIREDRGVYSDGWEPFLGGSARCMARNNGRPHGAPKDGKAQLKGLVFVLSEERRYITDWNGLVLEVETRFSYSRSKDLLRRTLPQLQNDDKGESRCRQLRECTGEARRRSQGQERQGGAGAGYHGREIIITFGSN